MRQIAKPLWLALALMATTACQPKSNAYQDSAEELGASNASLLTDAPMNNPCQTTISQGIAGRILWLEGNRMPSMDPVTRKAVEYEDVGIAREIHVYTPTKMTQVSVSEAVFYTNFPSKPVAVGRSDAQGCFEIALPPGEYTLVVKEEKGFYGNMFDGDGNIYPITVEANKVTPIRFLVDYMASY
ncbi:carboxypeptidase-like regulatory domain-containing protein [Eisenibacter elegans]|uniref:carboxypeptidase-like regulatory domain-containing protein n=1 Tax=Eisenibacter elegans TaxID=997 RepID=UPI00041A215C|nr:carboxypeptidase-like regulatory domain-containing protein [Eisenibacter elegans]